MLALDPPTGHEHLCHILVPAGTFRETTTGCSAGRSRIMNNRPQDPIGVNVQVPDQEVETKSELADQSDRSRRSTTMQTPWPPPTAIAARP
jgi:hypothetical protein